MEKYSQYRDRGSGIAPFFPVPTPPSGIYFPLHVFLAVIRTCLVSIVALTYFTLCTWLPVGSLVKKAALWCMIGIPGIWWIDLQIDGVRRGSLGQNQNRLPQPGAVIASSYTSPVDSLYLAAIFDPIFTASYPSTRLVERLTLFQALYRTFAFPQQHPPPGAKLVPISTILRESPTSIVVVFPECTTTNGRGILPFSPSLVTVPARTKIFPVSLRYTAADITTPLPGFASFLTFLWNLNSKPTHCIRVRIAEFVYNTSAAGATTNGGSSVKSRNTSEVLMDEGGSGDDLSNADTLVGSEAGLRDEEKNVLDRIGEALARLGRVKRVGLGVREKEDFVKMWLRKKK